MLEGSGGISLPYELIELLKLREGPNNLSGDDERVAVLVLGLVVVLDDEELMGAP